MEIWREILHRRVTLHTNGGNKHITDRPEEDIMNQLVEKTKALGHPLSFEEMKSSPEMFTPMTYAIYFDSFPNAAAKAWNIVKRDILSSNQNQ